MEPAVACLIGFRSQASHSYGKAAWVGCKLAGAEPRGISNAGQTVLARLMEFDGVSDMAPACRLCGGRV